MARDLFQEAGISVGQEGEGRDLFAEAGVAAPKPAPASVSSATAADYLRGIDTGIAAGVVNIGAGIGTVLQDPGGAMVSGATGARALADKGISWLINQAGGEAQPNTETQQAAQTASQVAAERRAANAAEPLNLPARLGKFMESDSRRVAEEIQAKERSDNPELVRQQQAMSEAEGFVGNLKAAWNNPLALTNTLARSGPDMAAGVGIGATLARSGVGLAGVSAAGTASEAGSSALQAREGTYQQVAGMPLETLAKSPRFNAILAETGGDAVRAREALANELADQTPVLSGLGTSAGTLLTNRLFGGDATAKSIVGGDKMTAREFGKRVLQDTVEEGVQGVPEDTVQYGAQSQADPTKKWDPAGALAQNMVAGFAMGAGGHGLAYGRENLPFNRGSNDPNATPGTPPGQAPANPPPAGTGQPPASGPAATGGSAAPVEAAGVASNDTTEAERALREPVNITALDRSYEIDSEVSKIGERLSEISPENGYGDMFDKERADLQAKSQALAQEREAIVKTWPVALPGAPTSFTTEAGARIAGEYALMDAGDLVTSHDENLRSNPAYPPALQPRDRSRSASELQVSGIVQKLDPARLGLSADAANGAPIVGADGLVESGNARTIALKRVYQANGQKAEDYRAFLRDNAAQFGLSTAQVEGVQRPVLVRVRTTPVNRAEFARQANASTVAQMSPSEQAKSDANRIDTMEDLQPDESGDFSGPASRGFVRRFMNRLPVTEQSSMVDASGNLSSSGYARVRNAVLAKAYGDSPVLMRMTESLDDNLRNVSKALITAAPRVAQSRQLVSDGARFDADITPDLMVSVEELSRLKDAGTSIQDALSQTGMFGEKYSPESRELLQFLAENIRRPRRMADFIVAYTEALDRAGDPNQGSLLGDVTAPEKSDLLKAARRTLDEQGTNGNDPQAAGPAGGGSQAAPGSEGGAQGVAASQAPASGTANEGAEADAGQSGDWVSFPPDSGTLGVPRAEMPQIRQQDRGALVNFLKGKGVDSAQDEVPADSLKATQAEYSRGKVQRFAGWQEGRNRAVLVSSDGYVLDGHHQWLAKMSAAEPVRVIRFDAPIKQLLGDVAKFPSVKTSEGLETGRAAAMADFKDAMADLAQLATRHTRTNMLPENTPGLMPTLVKLFDAAIKIVGTDLKAATKWVKEQLKANPDTKTIWNKIDNALYQKAALRAMEAQTTDDGLFAPAPSAAKPVAQEQPRSNFVPPAVEDILPADVVAQADGYVEQFYKKAEKYTMPAEARAEAESLLAPFLRRANESKAAFDQAIIGIAKNTGALGQMLAPVKSAERSVEKMHQDAQAEGRAMRAEDLNDLLRATIVVQSYDDAGAVLADIGKRFEVIRIKDKSTEAMRARQGGYADVTAFVRMPNGTVAEIQINVPAMISAKSNQGHKLYEAARVLPDGDAKKAEIYSAMSEIYEAAFVRAAKKPSTPPLANAREPEAQARNAASDIGAPVRGPLGSMPGKGTSEAPSSDARNQAPSGNRTYSSPENPATNSQPAGNLSGNFIDKPSSANIPQKPINGYTTPDLFGESNANAQPGNDGAQGAGASSSQESGPKGRGGQVRGGSGQPNLGRDGAADTGAAPARGLGQAGADGVGGADARGGRNEPGSGAGRPAGVPAGRDIPPKSGRNYEFGPDDLTYQGSWAKKAAQNVEAVELLKRLEAEKRQATRAEQKTLATFIGWGSSELANNLFGPKTEKVADAIALYDQAIEALGDRAFLTNSNYALYGPAFKLLQLEQPSLNWYTAGNITRAMLDKARPDASARRWLELRKRLKAVLTDAEWAESSRSTQYAHYTSKAVVQSMWRAMERMGFKGGAVLEPGAGIGVFPGLMPAAMAHNSIYTGIEYDGITGGILKQLFPDERILVESFVDSKLPKNFYDVAVGNPPFSGTKILGDPEYAKRALSLHDYFFAKSIDRTKPGGLVVYVTSRYTMDKLDDKAREYLAERADLVGAIRLPQTAFQKNAGTEVVTDVIFLRKKVPGEVFEGGQAWARSVPVNGADGKPLMVSGNKEGAADQPAMVNEYFVANPGMVLGKHSAAGSMRKDREYTVEPYEGDIEAQFDKAVQNLPANIYKAGRGTSAEAAQVREIDFNPKAKKEGNYYVSDAGALMVREGGVGQRVELRAPKDVELIKDFVPLRDALKQAHYDQLNDGDWQPSLAKLNKAYQAFTKKHGQINQFTVKMVKTKVVDEDTGETFVDEEPRRTYTLLRKLQDDPDYTLVAALETINDDTGLIQPSSFLSDRVLGKPVVVDVATPTDALLAVLNDVGRVDIPTIAARLHMTEAETIEALGTAIYEDPESDWQTADEYLSGNVKRKLKNAREVAKADTRFERNVRALEAVQPEPKTPSQINASLGMNWIPGSVYEDFLRETTSVKARVEWNARTKQWIVEEIAGGATLAARADWGTARRNATDLLEHALTGRTIRIEGKVGSGKDAKTVFDPAATEAANAKLNVLKEAFQAWLWKDADRTDLLVRRFNDLFNTTVPRSFDGRHLTLPGTSKAFNVFDHVKRGAWRIIQRGNTYLAHAVGSGKTFQMVIAAMEQKRLGLKQKPMIVVPNHMLQQFAHEWQMLYPAARLMVADENNFHTDNRRRFVSRVALSDLDGVIITHSAFKLLDLDPEFKQKMIEEQLAFMRAALEEAGGDPAKPGKNGRDPRIKQIEKQIENMEQKLEAAMSPVGKDKNVRFDELGVDMLYVDEAHQYRKLNFTTTRQVKGLSPVGSGQSFDLYMKSQYLEEKTPGRSLVMASGTPVTNTLAELYTVQRFMDKGALEERGIEDFDSWAAMFGRENTALEPNAAGKYEPVTRFSKFVNVPELTQMFREYADVLTSDTLAALLGDKRPKVQGGARRMVITPKTAAYGRYQKELAQRVEDSRAWKPSKEEPDNPDPIVRIIGDGRLAAIDMRFVEPGSPSDPSSKLNTMIDDVIALFKETADHTYRDKAGQDEPNKGSSMMVFSDLGFGAIVAANRGFNARAWFEKRLRDAGVPTGQVAFMSDYKKSADKLKLFKDVNAGRVRLLVGSSKNMGTGVNAQQRLMGLFHLDSPWYPADLEQREGRIVRQGNKNPLVRLSAYAAKGTYDENMWKMLASKQFFIDQALSGDPNLREIEDLDSQSQFDLAAAMVAEDPRVMQLAGARAEVEKMHRLYQAHEQQRESFKAAYRVAQDTIRFNEKLLPAADANAAKVTVLSGDNFVAKAGKQSFTSRTDWAQALVDRFKDLAARAEGQTQTVGEISGFKVAFEGNTHGSDYMPRLVLETPETVVLTADADTNLLGLAIRATNAVASVATLPARLRERIVESRAKMEALQPRLETPFPMAQMLADKLNEAAELEAVLIADGKRKDRPGAVESEAFKRWFGDSKVVDAEGKPLVMYHGARGADISEFRPATYFTEDAGEAGDYAGSGAVYPVFISIKNPYEASDEPDAENRSELTGLDEFNTQELAAQGYDGVIARRNGVTLWAIPFGSAQVKSATGNNGDFDAGNVDIRLSRGAGGGMPVETLQALADRVRAKMPNMPPVRVMATPAKAPQELKNYILGQDAWNDAEGAMHEGELYLFASGLSDELRAEHVLLEHEAAHFGLRAVLGETLPTVLRFIYANNGAVRASVAKLQARGRLSTEDATEEAIVDIPTRALARVKGWRRVVKATRDWLAANGFDRMAERLTTWLSGSLNEQERADLFVADLVRKARGYIAGREPGNPGNYAGVTRLSTLADDIAKQEKWLSVESRSRGFKDIDDLVDRDYPLFVKLAELWRAKNPAENGVLLSRSPSTQKADQKEFPAILPRSGLQLPSTAKQNKPGTARTLTEKNLSGYTRANPSTALSRAPATAPAAVQKTVAERADAIIRTKVGSFAPLDAIAKLATKVTGLELLTGAVYRRAGRLLDRYTPEMVKAGVVSDYGVPEAVIDQRALLQARQRVQLRKAGSLIDQLSTLTREESRVAYEWMNMDGSDPQAYMSMLQGLPEESVKVLTDVQKMIDKLSRDAVGLGQLSQDAYDRNRFAYLRRSYAKHVMEQTSGEKAKRARTISVLGDQYKGRGLTEAAPMDKLKAVAPEWWGRKLKEGKADAALKGEKFIRLERRAASGQGVSPLPGMQGKALGKLLEVMYWPVGEPITTKFADWEKAGTFEVRDVKGPNAILWRDFTKDEREAMGEVDEARFAIAKTLHGMIHDVEVGRYLEWLAYSQAKKAGDTIPGVVVEASERFSDTFKPDEWVLVPETKIPGTSVAKYGKLAGRYLPGPVWNDLRQVVNGKFKPLGETYATILSAWKTAKTALSPAVHMNNVMSNFVMADWHDVHAAHVGKALRLVLAASQPEGLVLGNTGKLARRVAGFADREAAALIMQRYQDSGGTLGSWATNEIAQDQLEPLLASMEKELAATAGNSVQAQIGVMAALQQLLARRFPRGAGCF